jgi:hypothetical protein
MRIRFIKIVIYFSCLEPTPGFEPGTSSLPRKCSAPELCGLILGFPLTIHLERVMGIEPTSSAWKAEVLPLNYTRLSFIQNAFFRRAKILTVSFT